MLVLIQGATDHVGWAWSQARPTGKSPAHKEAALAPHGRALVKLLLPLP
jgi:hypothetical protein